MMKRALWLCVWAFVSGCAPSTELEPQAEAPPGATDSVEPVPAASEPGADVAIPADGSAAARAMLRVVHRSDVAALRAARVSETGASAIVGYRAGADGVRRTSDDREVYSLADLRALGVSPSDLGSLALAASATRPADEACAAVAPRGLPSELVVTPDDGDARVLALIAGAARSIDVVMYQLSSFAVRGALTDARVRGVRVRVILDRKQSRTAALVADLQAKNIDAKASSTEFAFTHQKTMLVDGNTLLVFSGNFDRASFTTGRNFGVVVRDPEDIWDVEDLFEADWNEREPDVACTRLVVAPGNARDRVVALIDGAASEILVEALYASDAAVLDALVRAKRRGISVRVLFNDPRFGVGDASDEAALLEREGIEVRRSPVLFIHAKLVVADRGSAFIGSENFSTNSLRRNREVGVIVRSADLDVGSIVTVFERDFAAGAPFAAPL